jgi:Chemotaxis phosphatase CheX
MTPALNSSCLDALVDATTEVSSTVLSGASCELLDTQTDYGTGHGAYLSLNTDEEPIQVGLLAEPSDCQVLSKALLGMEAGDEDLPDGDVSDAMCEIINMIAGGLKRRVTGQLPVTLGLPMFVTGHPLPNPHQEVASRSLKIGDVSVSLILLTQSNASGPHSRRSPNLQSAGREPAKEQSV